ncbi:MAG: chemotaxis protein CheR, partial [Deltaproteobacteria bacterium]|nr:chemotaxis protein CheR [Deltaproteobacteria bacterium]
SVEWLDRAFTRRGNTYCLAPGFRNKVNFFARDIRRGVPAGPFDMVLCRNLAFTYFDMDLRKKILEWIQDSLFEGGALVLGIHESLPDGVTGFCPWIPDMRIYRKYTNKG